MSHKIYILLLIFFCFINCKNKNTKKSAEDLTDIPLLEKTDSIHPNNKFYIEIIAKTNSNNEKANAVFNLFLTKNNKLVYSDSILTVSQEILFEDYNQDDIRDILIQNTFDVRSNSTYNLYLLSENGKVKKIKNFNQIKNPEYLKQYNLISNLVISGRNWTSFYNIESDSIKKFNYLIYRDETDKSEIKYLKEYNKAIKEIFELNKNQQ